MTPERYDLTKVESVARPEQEQASLELAEDVASILHTIAESYYRKYSKSLPTFSQGGGPIATRIIVTAYVAGRALHPNEKLDKKGIQKCVDVGLDQRKLRIANLKDSIPQDNDLPNLAIESEDANPARAELADSARLADFPEAKAFIETVKNREGLLEEVSTALFEQFLNKIPGVAGVHQSRYLDSGKKMAQVVRGAIVSFLGRRLGQHINPLLIADDDVSVITQLAEGGNFDAAMEEVLSTLSSLFAQDNDARQREMSHVLTQYGSQIRKALLLWKNEKTRLNLDPSQKAYWEKREKLLRLLPIQSLAPNIDVIISPDLLRYALANGKTHLWDSPVLFGTAALPSLERLRFIVTTLLKAGYPNTDPDVQKLQDAQTQMSIFEYEKGALEIQIGGYQKTIDLINQKRTKVRMPEAPLELSGTVRRKLTATNTKIQSFQRAESANAAWVEKAHNLDLELGTDTRLAQATILESSYESTLRSNETALAIVMDTLTRSSLRSLVLPASTEQLQKTEFREKLSAQVELIQNEPARFFRHSGLNTSDLIKYLQRKYSQVVLEPRMTQKTTEAQEVLHNANSRKWDWPGFEMIISDEMRKEAKLLKHAGRLLKRQSDYADKLQNLKSSRITDNWSPEVLREVATIDGPSLDRHAAKTRANAISEQQLEVADLDHLILLKLLQKSYLSFKPRPRISVNDGESAEVDIERKVAEMQSVTDRYRLAQSFWKKINAVALVDRTGPPDYMTLAQLMDSISTEPDMADMLQLQAEEGQKSKANTFLEAQCTFLGVSAELLNMKGAKLGRSLSEILKTINSVIERHTKVLAFYESLHSAIELPFFPQGLGEAITLNECMLIVHRLITLIDARLNKASTVQEKQRLEAALIIAKQYDQFLLDEQKLSAASNMKMRKEAEVIRLQENICAYMRLQNLVVDASLLS